MGSPGNMAQMGEVMDAMDRVANVLLGNRGNTYCDSCLAESLTFEGPDNVRQVTVRLPTLHCFSGDLAPVQCAVATGS
jgi:hypothetical protein